MGLDGLETNPCDSSNLLINPERTYNPPLNEETISLQSFQLKQFEKNSFKYNFVPKAILPLFEIIRINELQQLQIYYLKMKYSIKVNPQEFELSSNILKPNHKISLIQSNKSQIAFHQIQQNENQTILKIDVVPIEKQQNTEKRQKSIEATFRDVHFDASRIMGSQFVGEECFVICKNPIEIYFIHRKQRKAIPINLENKIDLVEASCIVNYPLVIVYGHHSQKYMNYLYSINLITLEVKEICNGKGYSPKGRSGFFSLFSEDRFYVFGGKNSKGQKCQQLLWTFDFQKGYWFALEMKYQNSEEITPFLNCEYESGKVLLINSNQIRVIELYQSRIGPIPEIPAELKKVSLIGLFHTKERIWGYNENEIAAWSVSICKNT